MSWGGMPPQEPGDKPNEVPPMPIGMPPGPGPSDAGSAVWTPTDALSFAWARAKSDPWVIFGSLILAFMVIGVPSGLMGGADAVYKQVTYHGRPPGLFEPVSVSLQIVGSLGQAILSALITPGVTLFALRVARGERYSFGDVFSRMSLFVPMLIVSFLIGFGVMFGLLVLIVPGVVLALGWSFSILLVVDKGLDPIAAMKESWRLTEGHKLNIFWFSLLVFLLTLAGLCACCIGAMFVQPVSTIALAYIYLRVTGQQVASIDSPPTVG